MLSKRYAAMLHETGLDDDAWKVARLIAFLWLVGLDGERDAPEVLNLVADQTRASFNRWVDALVAIYGDDVGHEGRERRIEFMRFVDPKRWSDRDAAMAWRAAV